MTDEAQKVTADGSTPYDKALLLQDYFRDPTKFTYDLNVGPGHSNRALETFLFGGGRGYRSSSQARSRPWRSVGLPARVAVGFTPGIRDPNDPNLYRVRGIHAHAWPEVYLGQYGWVPFEPTPTRGPPGARGLPRRGGAPGDRERRRHHRRAERPQPGPGGRHWP